jgi:hypothetical protein
MQINTKWYNEKADGQEKYSELLIYRLLDPQDLPHRSAPIIIVSSPIRAIGADTPAMTRL